MNQKHSNVVSVKYLLGNGMYFNCSLSLLNSCEVCGSFKRGQNSAFLRKKGDLVVFEEETVMK